MSPKKTAAMATVATAGGISLVSAFRVTPEPLGLVVAGGRVLLFTAAVAAALVVLMSTAWIRGLTPTRQRQIIWVTAAGTVTGLCVLPLLPFLLHDIFG